MIIMSKLRRFYEESNLHYITCSIYRRTRAFDSDGWHTLFVTAPRFIGVTTSPAEQKGTVSNGFLRAAQCNGKAAILWATRSNHRKPINRFKERQRRSREHPDESGCSEDLSE